MDSRSIEGEEEEEEGEEDEEEEEEEATLSPTRPTAYKIQVGCGKVCNYSQCSRGYFFKFLFTINSVKTKHTVR